MNLTIAVYDDRVVPVELDDEGTVETLKAILEAETGMPSASQALIHNGNTLPSTSTLASHGVKSGDLIMLIPAAATASRAPSGSGPAGAQARPTGGGDQTFLADGSARDPDQLMGLLRSYTPAQRSQLPHPVSDAVASNDVAALQNALRELAAARHKAEEEERRFMRLAAEDPLNPKVQKRLEEVIQEKNVAENFEAALEYNPEAFGRVIMLYVDFEVNGVPLKAFVDSGAESTIMSKSCAERCGLLRLLDRRYQGMAVGVGSAKILGRIHMAPAKAGGQHIPISITVLESDGMEFLFGLDNLKRHQCSIDLQANKLHFPNMDIHLPFLAEHELPRTGMFADKSGAPSGAPSPQAPSGPLAAPAGAPAPMGHQSSPAASQQQQQQGSMPAGWEEKVQRLMQLGFPQAECLGALRAAEGNEEVAGSLLFSSQF